MEKVLLSELCREHGVSRRVIQGMEAAGLVKATSKNKYGYLEYDEAAQRRISLIRDFQKMGFKNPEIAKLIDADNKELANGLKIRIRELKLQSIQLEDAIRLACRMLEQLDRV